MEPYKLTFPSCGCVVLFARNAAGKAILNSLPGSSVVSCHCEGRSTLDLDHGVALERQHGIRALNAPSGVTYPKKAEVG
jgi:hypothetical protein